MMRMLTLIDSLQVSRGCRSDSETVVYKNRVLGTYDTVPVLKFAE
jgi:hypothetical protein